MRDFSNDKALNFVFYEILEQVLNLSANPKEFAKYLTQKIREIVGVKSVIIALKSEKQQNFVYSVFPVRKFDWAISDSMREFIEFSFLVEDVEMIKKETCSNNTRVLLNNIQVENSIIIPLQIGEHKEGSLLLLDLVDSFGIDEIIKLLSHQAGVFALIIRNSHLYHNLELEVSERTNEIAAQNEEYELLTEQLSETVNQLDILNSQLKNSEEQFRQLFENMEQGFALHEIVNDENGRAVDYRFVLVNKAFEKLTGLVADKIIDKKVSEALPGTEKSWIEKYGKVANNGSTLHFQNYSNAIGKYFDVVAYSPKQGFFAVVFTDITNIINAQDELNHAKEKAEESDRLKSVFLANMSHEIRTPMNGILGFADLLSEPDLSGDDMRKYITIIEKSGKRMLNIINDLIDISKVEAGQMEVKISEMNVKTQLDYFYSFFLPEAEQKKIRFVYNTKQLNELKPVLTDKEKFSAVFINLLKNAVKYTERGIIEFGLSEITEKNELCFYVKDSGIGIDDSRQNAIFERFVQADLSISKPYEGAGLGLSITKAFVEMLNGRIWLNSKLGEGSTFYFTIPYDMHKTKISIKKRVQVKQASTQSVDFFLKKILIVEDDEVTESYLKVILKSRCDEVLIARTGHEAIKIFELNRDISLILMDIQMPDMDGYTATKNIRELDSDVIIIAQTAYALEGDREKAIESGSNDYISKPIRKASLLKLIGKYFRS